MSVSEVCTREVIVMRRDETIMAAARLMREHHVGDVLVIEDRNGVQVPVGIVTDRDLVVEVMAPGLDHMVITVGDIMTQDLFTAKDSMGTFEAIQYMRSKTVSRLPIVDEKGGLVGVISLDDILELLAEEMLDLSKLVGYERKKEMRHRR